MLCSSLHPCLVKWANTAHLTSLLILIWACIISGALMAGASKLAATLMLVIGSAILTIGSILYNFRIVKKVNDTAKVAPEDKSWFQGSTSSLDVLSRVCVD